MPFGLIQQIWEIVEKVYDFADAPSWLGWGVGFPVCYICSVTSALPVSGHQRKWLTFVCLVSRPCLTVRYCYHQVHLGALNDGDCSQLHLTVRCY